MASELRRSLEGRLPQPNHPVCVEILMESTEVYWCTPTTVSACCLIELTILFFYFQSDTLVLEVWSVSIDHRLATHTHTHTVICTHTHTHSQRDIGVSVSHVLYPRLSLMLKSVMSLARTTPTYRLSRQQDNDLKFT